MYSHNKVLKSLDQLYQEQKTNILMGGHAMISEKGIDNSKMGIFTDYTKLIVESYAKNKNIDLIAIINDWSLINKSKDSGDIRQKFWQDFGGQPYFHIDKKKQVEGVSLGGNESIGKISEKRLQNMFYDITRGKEGKRFLELISSVNKDFICMYQNDDSTAKCSTEILMFLSEMSKKGYQNLIGLMPSFCIDAIEPAVKAFANKEIRKILKVKIDEFTISRIYLNSGNPSTEDDVLKTLNIKTTKISDDK